LYSTCLFCNGSLDKNEVLERFPVGRRLAFDSAKGRLWVVCRKCERWNLTPLETRWEAIEDAERLFGGTRMRIATDNIGLARLSEGLELVRVGKPPRLELSAWRYGDQFGRRRRKQVAAAVPLAILPLVSAALVTSGVLTVANVGFSAWNYWYLRRHATAPVVTLRDDAGRQLVLSRTDVNSAALMGAGGDIMNWHLKVYHRDRPLGHVLREAFKDAKAGKVEPARLRGEAAHSALARMMPYVNYAGASIRKVREADELIDKSLSTDSLIYAAATTMSYNNMIPGENLLSGLSPRFRLAMEMVLHADDERRALEGELAELEARWKEAEEIAAIADSLLLPSGTEEKLAEFRSGSS
jgi:hypothetical protein